MKRTFLSRCAVIIALLLSLCLAGCSASGREVSPTDSPEPTTASLVNRTGDAPSRFTLSITLDASQHRLVVTQSILYQNNTGVELDEIYFNLIPEAFQADGGGIEMGDVFVANQRVQLEQVKKTVSRLALPDALPAGSQLYIQMEYVVKIPNIKNRFGYQGSTYNLGNFIVTPAVYDEEGWAVKPYVDIGDAFYTDIASYEVKITVPEGFTVAATGEEVGIGLYRAENVRDFAFCASDSYKTLLDTQDGVAITVYYGDDIETTARRAMDNAKRSLELYSDAFGQYPYSTLSVVMSGLTGGVNGMEYPTLIMVTPEIPIEEFAEMGFDVSDSRVVELLMVPFDSAVCHEIAHQWFYGIVGNDQISEAWLDEGFCRYSEYLYQQAYPPEQSEEYGVYLLEDRLEMLHEDVYGQKSGAYDEADIFYIPDTTPLQNSLYYWADKDPMGYGQIYDKGASLLYAMRQQMGAQAFDAALKEYVERFAYDFVTTDSFKAFWNEKADFAQLFDMYLK